MISRLSGGTLPPASGSQLARLPVSAFSHESQQPERLSQEGIVNLPCHFEPNRKLALIRWGCPQRQLADKRRRLDLLFLRHSFGPCCSIGTPLSRYKTHGCINLTPNGKNPNPPYPPCLKPGACGGYIRSSGRWPAL
jgi:hypothetical protein